MYQIHIITLFPEIFPGPLNISVLKNSLNQLYSLNIINLRHFGIGKHKIVDDAPYGGGSGMIIKPDVVNNAILSLNLDKSQSIFIFMSPRGDQLSQKYINNYLEYNNIIILCGRFEGVDQRILNYWNFQEIRVSDVVLCGGELPAMILCEAFIRNIPNVISADSLIHETIPGKMNEHDHYTRPLIWNDIKVPQDLTCGNHKKIIAFREYNKI